MSVLEKFVTGADIMAALVSPPAPLAVNFGSFDEQFLEKALALHRSQTQDPRQFMDVFGRFSCFFYNVILM